MDRSVSTAIPLAPRAPGTVVPLTPIQLRSWTSCIGNGGFSDMKVSLSSVRISGPLDLSILKSCLQFVVSRHESLRTRITTFAGIPQQEIDADHRVSLPMIDISRTPSRKIEATAQQIADELIRCKVSLSVGPLFSATLIRMADDQHALILSTDHIISDAASCNVLSKDLWTAYNLSTQLSPNLPPPLPLQFADYAVWHELMRDATKTEYERYCKDRPIDPSWAALPVAPFRSITESASFRVVEVPLGRSLSTIFGGVARKERTMLPLLVLTIYVCVICRWFNRQTLALSVISHGRHARPELQQMIGYLATPILFRLMLSNDDSFVDVLRKVNEEFCSSHHHQRFSYGLDLISMCTPSLCFNWLPARTFTIARNDSEISPDRLRMEPFSFSLNKLTINDPLFALGLRGFLDEESGIVMAVTYRSDLFTAKTIASLARNLQFFVERFASSPLTRVSSIPIDCTDVPWGS